ncbi:serine hydrolase domain-containing protein [Aureibaculum conchae]|uniref:serine hydrolase domain-containing protein n=1 Tax=Aureibaculum sp. 2308TA14-22 TaxID=3108392 RepID=UPI003396FAF9
MRHLLTLLLLSMITASCSLNDNTIIEENNNEIYFPPLSGNEWEAVSPSSLNWNTTELEELYTYLELKNTKGFIILKDGKIAVEKYFNGHSQNTSWRWFSAVKSLTATAIGIAQDEEFININNRTSDYLGSNWSILTKEKQDLITVKNHLSMTTGLKNTPNNILAWTCIAPLCMSYNYDAGTKWQYHQGAFSQLQRILSLNTGKNFKVYIKEKILDKTGISGSWETFLDVNIFSSSTRGMARFGLLALNKGKWEEKIIVSEDYFNEMTNTSQNLNKAYGYLWWLNGKESYKTPQSEQIYAGKLIPNAPNDLLAALGANDQKIYVIPSKNMVVIRCGESAENAELATSSFDNELWGRLNSVTN